MVKYFVFESSVLTSYRRDLINFDVAQSELIGYLKCMFDMGVIEQDRMSEEVERVTKRLLDWELRK